MFPLPTNDEQLAIIRRLHGHSGVLVQGPPGTGKSHTIVNLVCHLLAQGRRVLVTSQTPRALKVLREKIPEAILPLVVSLLGEDSESRQNLEYSVQGILRHVNAADPVDPGRLISEKTQERASLRSRLAALRRRLREVREAETTVYCIPGTPYQGTAQTIAQTLSHDQASLSWLTDQISADAEPPLTDGGLKELHAFWEQYSERSITYALPAPESLPTADQLEAAQNLCSRTGDALRQSAVGTDLEFGRRLCELGRARLDELRKMAEYAVQSSEWLAKRAEPWIVGVRQEVLAGRVQPWSSLEKATSKVLEALAGKSAEPDIKAPAGVTRSQLLADAADLLAHLKRGGMLGFWVFRPEVVRRCLYILHETRFAGRACNSPAVIKSLLAHLQEQDALDRAWLEWSVIVEPPEGTTRHRLACLEQHHEVLNSILRLGSLVSNVGIAVGERRPNGTPDGSCWLRELLRNVQTAIALSDDRDSQAAFSVLIERISKCRILVNSHSIVDDLIVAAEHCNVPEYRVQLAKLVELHQERSQTERFLSLDKRLREVAPALADALKSPEARPTLAAQLDSFRNAWAWKRATAWLERFSAEQSANVAPELDEVERRLQEATATLVALKAWKSCSDKLASDSMQQGALVAWQKMVKKIGKGTGKYAETYRRDARKYLQQCRNAIPAWIMPLYRVAEQVEIEPGIFDVVIVDESSQTGPEGLILQYLAKQCVIVGDDKQISPEGGFIEGTQVRTLMEQHLDGFPFSETLGPATSLFDQAAVRYGNRITLREHFRCMPEIIRFSDELCYADTPLIPLRQYPPSRLPPLQVRFIVDGYREGTAQQAINRPEAAAVAKTLIDCLNDPRYKGKSFGVICLQGRAQAQLIENMILDKLGPHPFKDEKTRLLCGDPYSFQGDERDVVFLSMVASVEGDTRTSPLTREPFRQRFNVAASRARDQAWLFHSIRESDLHPDCMRRHLLHYYYNPCGNSLNLNGKGRTISKFQREVGEALSKAGFRILSEFEVAGKFIDWVVEDRERRLAIECDGDAWHGPDRYEADMARQRMLERCGWRFIRIRGSKFYANQSRAIREQIEAIRNHGLEPCINSDSDDAPRDWVKEISGEDCMEAFGTQGIAEENVFEQQELFPGESEESEMAEAAELAENNAPQASRPANDCSNRVPSNSKASASAMTDKPPLAQRPVDGAIPARRVPSPSASERPRSTIVNAQERAAVFKALDEADRPLIMWQIARGSKISQRRVEEIIPILVQEGIIRRVESDIAVMYARA